MNNYNPYCKKSAQKEADRLTNKTNTKHYIKFEMMGCHYGWKVKRQAEEPDMLKLLQD
jgi:hypothetical protein